MENKNMTSKGKSKNSRKRTRTTRHLRRLLRNQLQEIQIALLTGQMLSRTDQRRCYQAQRSTYTILIRLVGILVS